MSFVETEDFKRSLWEITTIAFGLEADVSEKQMPYISGLHWTPT